jgi:hypothetical protein
VPSKQLRPVIRKQQAQASVADQQASYNEACAACLEGKGYTVK